MSITPSDATFFEAMYQQDRDPWNFAGDAYELGRYRSIIAALAHRRYRHAFEPGCSVGVLTEQLASLCDAVEAIDFSPTAVERTRERCAALPNVSVRCTSLPDRMPVVGFDLLVLSEIGYYFTPADLGRLAPALIEPMLPGSTLLAAHWLGGSPDHIMSGDEVHAILGKNPSLQLEHSERHERFRLDRWVRV